MICTFCWCLFCVDSLDPEAPDKMKMYWGDKPDIEREPYTQAQFYRVLCVRIGGDGVFQKLEQYSEKPRSFVYF